MLKYHDVPFNKCPKYINKTFFLKKKVNIKLIIEHQQGEIHYRREAGKHLKQKPAEKMIATLLKKELNSKRLLTSASHSPHYMSHKAFQL